MRAPSSDRHAATDQKRCARCMGSVTGVTTGGPAHCAPSTAMPSPFWKSRGLVVYTDATSAVVGSMVVRTSLIWFAGKPPRVACSRTASASGAI
jgi:hypothetical protein